MIRLFNVIDNIAYVIAGRKQSSKQELDVTAGTHVVDITSPNVTFDKVKKGELLLAFQNKETGNILGAALYDGCLLYYSQ